MDKVDAEYEAHWDCPKCDSRTYEYDEGVEEDGDEFIVTCQHEIDKGGEDLEVCNHKYRVRR